MTDTCSDCKYFSNNVVRKCRKFNGFTTGSSPKCNEKETLAKPEFTYTKPCPRCKAVMNWMGDELGGYSCSKCNFIYGRGRY